MVICPMPHEPVFENQASSIHYAFRESYKIWVPVFHGDSMGFHWIFHASRSQLHSLNTALTITSVPTARWYSESDVQEADEGMSCLLLLMREPNSEWAWFKQCDVTLHQSLLTAHFVVFCLFTVHVTSVTSVSRSVHDSSPVCESYRKEQGLNRVLLTEARGPIVGGGFLMRE